ncbi:MAG: NAD-dependent epimerase/dehydratase family protein [Elusimicrobia bacterium]|nr:NAD-dependent epimerase/dehydratase family protein [Elusimicrobiota bacterium]
MTDKKIVLVTGGAGFIASHLADHLLARGYKVRALDSLEPQVHPGGKRPGYLDARVELLVGRVSDRGLLEKALDGVWGVAHLASAVGVGQSMYEIARYTELNVQDTAVFLEVLSRRREKPARMMVASSMSLYGEGLYRCPACGADDAPRLRPAEQLKARKWELLCPGCWGPMEPRPTPETKLPYPTSVYSINKRDQEEMCLALGRAYKVPTNALRFFNAFGSRQALSNPYTGVAAIFAGRLMNGREPLLFEDGLQSRDFIHISELVAGIRLSLEREDVSYETLNMGSGRPTSVLAVAEALAAAFGSTVGPKVLGEFREGDTRHCFADMTKTERLLGFKTKMSFAEGLAELLAWMRTQKPEDKGDAAIEELRRHNLTG